MNLPFDGLVLAVFLFVQWRVSSLLRAKGVARPLVLLFNLLAVLGYALSFSQLDSFFRLPSRGASLAGAVTLYYIGIGSVAVTVSLLNHFLDRRADKPSPGRRRAIQTAGSMIVAAPLAVLGYGTFIERLDFRVREVDVPLPDLSPGLDDLLLLQLSDIHLSAFLSESQLARVIDEANQLHPHLALVTGDLISSRGDPLDACIRQIARLRSDAGTFGCLGNHEHHAGAEDYATLQAARAGIPFLRHQAHLLHFGGAALNLAGVDYQPLSAKPRYLAGTERLRVPGALNLLLSHNPDVWPVAVRKGFQCMLSGHTHGGQIAVEIFDRSLNPARFFTPYVYGLYRSGAAAAYVTRGIGTIGIPTRIGAPPEIALLRLRKV